MRSTSFEKNFGNNHKYKPIPYYDTTGKIINGFKIKKEQGGETYVVKS